MHREKTWDDVGPATLIVDTTETFLSADSALPRLRVRVTLRDVEKERLLNTIRVVALWAGSSSYSVPLIGTAAVCQCACVVPHGTEHFMCPAHSSHIDVHTKITFNAQPMTLGGQAHYSIAAAMAPIEIPATPAASAITLELSMRSVDNGSSTGFLTRKVMCAVADHFFGVPPTDPRTTSIGTSLVRKFVSVEVVPRPGAPFQPDLAWRHLHGVSIIETADMDFGRECEDFLAAEAFKDAYVSSQFTKRDVQLAMRVVEIGIGYNVILSRA